MTENIQALADIIAANKETTRGRFALNEPVPPHVITPSGYVVHYLEPAARPEYPVGKATLDTAESFVAYVEKFKTVQTALALDSTGGVFTAIFDYHFRDTDGPAFGEAHHSARFVLELSDTFAFWSRLHDKWLTQAQIVELLEERAVDVTTPSVAELLKVAMDFKSTSSEEYVTRYNRLTQRTELVVKQEENARGGEAVIPPDSLTLEIPVYKHGQMRALTALFSWKGKPDQFAKLRFLNLPTIIDEAQTELRTFVATATGLPVWRGKLA